MFRCIMLDHFRCFHWLGSAECATWSCSSGCQEAQQMVDLLLICSCTNQGWCCCCCHGSRTAVQAVSKLLMPDLCIILAGLFCDWTVELMFWKDVSQLQARSGLVIFQLVEHEAGATCSGGMHLHVLRSAAVIMVRKNNVVNQARM